MQSAMLDAHPRCASRTPGQPQHGAGRTWRAFAGTPARQQLSRQQRVSVHAARQETKDGEDTDDKQAKAADNGKYPERTPWTGGWYGGEKGVQQFVAEFEKEPSKTQKKEIKKAAEKDPSVVNVSFKGKKVAARKVGDSGKDSIYIGARKGAAEGNDAPQYLVDDERKYPGRDPLGLVGGFAGGERGVQQYVEKGEVQLAEKGRKESSPLIFAGIVAVLGTAGTIFLTTAEEVGEELFESVENRDFSGASAAVQRVQQSAGGFDPTTKLGLEVALAGLGVVLLLVLGKKAAVGVANSAREGAVRLVQLVGFWGLVLFLAKYVVEH